ncbi:MAG: hypothetical protein PVF83_07115 [Anaerolineales bacterium]|jgi:hypothetical protein
MQKKRNPIFQEFSAMWRHFIRALPMTMAAMVLTAVVVLAATGTTDSPSGPTTAGSQMYTLEQVYDLLDTGTTSPKMTIFTEPLVAPGTGSMVTLDDHMAEALANRCNCATGTLNGTRWCDNGDGTVTDLIGCQGKGKCLVWLKEADWGGEKAWRVEITDLLDCGYSGAPCYDDAHTRASLAYTSPNLSDGSVDGDWRLPTYRELLGITLGTESVSFGNMRAFTGIQLFPYWSSTTFPSNDSWAFS